MNSIDNGWDCTKRAKKPYFHCEPSRQNKSDRKKHNIDKSKVDQLLICICTHTHGHKNIYKHRYICIFIHIIYHLSQIVLFNIMFESNQTIQLFN